VYVEPGEVTIPTVEGMSPEQAQAALEAAGFVVVGTEDQPSDTIDVGKVIDTDPPAGTSAEFGSDVMIIVSTGRGTVTVPDVICYNLGQAKARISDAGLVPVVASETLPPNPLCPNGNKVVDTDPGPNEQAQTGDQVLIYLPGPGPSPTGPTGGTGPTGPTGE
jgi:serine/threonine-protein kinase